MPANPWRRATQAVGVLVFCALTWQIAVSRNLFGGEGAETVKTRLREPKRRFSGAIGCKECHNNEVARTDKEFPPLCDCTEYGTWQRRDKHSQAFEVLTQKRALEMGELLHIADVKSAPECLSCHAASVTNKAEIGVTFKLQEGVTCVICHGPFDDWVVKHHGSGIPEERKAWREMDRKTKQTEWGMTDLWNSSTRAELCASCHIGNTNQGKFVTHAMYAAGHPPLPSFELASFSEEMPRHWQYLREKKPNVQALLRFKPEQARWEQTKLILVGGVVNLRESLNLLVTQAERCAKETDPQRQALDFALFDCAACHHELKQGGWRQARGYAGKPGRPTMQVWPATLAKQGLPLIDAKETDLRLGLQKLRAGFDARPFGQPERIAADASALVRWLDPVIARLADKNSEEKTAKSLLRSLTTLRESDYPDYETARQLAWAFAILTNELAWKPGMAETEQRETYAKRLKSINETLGGVLMLTLPSGHDKRILDELPRALKAQADYDPLRFVQAFRALGHEPQP